MRPWRVLLLSFGIDFRGNQIWVAPNLDTILFVVISRFCPFPEIIIQSSLTSHLRYLDLLLRLSFVTWYLWWWGSFFFCEPCLEINHYELAIHFNIISPMRVVQMAKAIVIYQLPSQFMSFFHAKPFWGVTLGHCQESHVASDRSTYKVWSGNKGPPCVAQVLVCQYLSSIASGVLTQVKLFDGILFHWSVC